MLVSTTRGEITVVSDFKRITFQVGDWFEKSFDDKVRDLCRSGEIPPSGWETVERFDRLKEPLELLKTRLDRNYARALEELVMRGSWPRDTGVVIEVTDTEVFALWPGKGGSWPFVRIRQSR